MTKPENKTEALKHTSMHYMKLDFEVYAAGKEATSKEIIQALVDKVRELVKEQGMIETNVEIYRSFDIIQGEEDMVFTMERDSRGYSTKKDHTDDFLLGGTNIPF